MYTVDKVGTPEFSADAKARLLALPAGLDLPVLFGRRSSSHGVQSMHLDARSAADFLEDALPVEDMPVMLAEEWRRLDATFESVLDFYAFARLRIFKTVPAFVLIAKAAA